MRSSFYRLLLASGMISLLAFQSSAQTRFSADKKFLKQIGGEFINAGSQYKVMMKELPAGKFPRNYDPAAKKFEASGPGWWCSGFYPGTLLYLWEQTKDKQLWNESQRILGLLKSQQFNTGTHDLGFMMYCSFGNLQRLQPADSTKDVLVKSAASLSTRFNPAVGCIKSWNSPDSSEFLVIIDNMMNLELLFYATKVTGDSSFYKIAVTHANTTMQHHFRNDNSSYHVVNYNKHTGEVIQRRTAQGYADESAWARGQAWGLYGYTMTYRETKDLRYLQMAEKIAAFMLDHPNLPADMVPYWDYNAPDIPNAPRDASAGAVMAAALLELCTYADDAAAKKYYAAAERILKSLSAPVYKAAPGTNGGFILMHSVGHLPAKSEINVGISYADYYYVEALKRYKEMAGRK
ncbi:glycoside hydrolase family 88 protein [Pseudobacter ginsenosidimutans]|uniref:Glycosyl hydrolase family 88 n=1 Tax=Pseudobacter ginsenosidimutans TaxID=661488 RepID=A0A4Q7MZI8_9BACT|nr:glycoside hydrolase family 88 protein [Pseudobacter ginsenosidimutans]QEC40627.1 glucuronyl hydrolase [Pseudobacter ginsenosidimutans]RZS72653.1 glycosyl hydrolase family 88 [Pseudobacter ginsenosidimutans]